MFTGPHVRVYAQQNEIRMNIIELRWSENVDNYFSASIMVEVENIRGVLAQVSSVIAQSNCNIESVNYTDTHDAGHNMMVFVISAKNLKQVIVNKR